MMTATWFILTAVILYVGLAGVVAYVLTRPVLTDPEGCRHDH